MIIHSMRRSVFLTALIALTISACQTKKLASVVEEPQTSLVFEPSGEYASMRIPALVVTKKGTLLAFCEGRLGTSSDWADMDMLLRRSTDQGKTWEPQVVVAARQGGTPTSNPVPIVDRDGTIHLLYQRDYARAYYIRSEDDGKTWTEAVDITYAFDAFRPEYDWKVLAPGPGHGIQLRNGRLLVPVWLSDPAKLVPHRSHSPSRIATIYSDDLGKTWKRGEIVPDTSAVRNPSETVAVELTDGRVMLNIRHSAQPKFRGVSYSATGSEGWTVPVINSDLFEPTCMAGLIRYSGDEKGEKSRLIFTNPDSRDIEKHPRKNLTVKLSYDEGESWKTQKVLNAGPSGYSDVAIGPDGTIYVLFETNTVKTGWNYSLVLKRFNMSWLTDGKDNGRK